MPSSVPDDIDMALNNEEDQNVEQETDSDLLAQNSEDIFDNIEANNVSDHPDKESAPHKAKEKFERATQLPLSRIKQIMKLDPEVALVNQDASFLLTKATELFINFMSKESYAVTLSSRRKVVSGQDVKSAINSDGPLFFLQGCLEN